MVGHACVETTFRGFSLAWTCLSASQIVKRLSIHQTCFIRVVSLLHETAALVVVSVLANGCKTGQEYITQLVRG